MNNGHPQIRFGEYLHYWSIDERVQRRSNVHVAVRSDRIGQLAAGRSRSCPEPAASAFLRKV
jgi:hypothetical protein